MYSLLGKRPINLLAILSGLANRIQCLPNSLTTLPAWKRTSRSIFAFSILGTHRNILLFMLLITVYSVIIYSKNKILVVFVAYLGIPSLESGLIDCLIWLKPYYMRPRYKAKIQFRAPSRKPKAEQNRTGYEVLGIRLRLWQHQLKIISI